MEPEIKTEAETENTKKSEVTPLQAVVELVKRGHRQCLPRLRELLAAEPEIYTVVGDLGRQAQRAWVELIGNKDDLLKESLVLYGEAMKKNLAGRGASQLELLAAERVVAAWLETEYLRTWRAQHADADGLKVAEFYHRRYEAADRRLEKALTSLATIKKLLPKTIQVEILQKPAATSRTEQIIPGSAMGDVPGMSRLQPRDTTPGIPAEPVSNGPMHVNGRFNHFKDVFETAPTE